MPYLHIYDGNNLWLKSRDGTFCHLYSHNEGFRNNDKTVAPTIDLPITFNTHPSNSWLFHFSIFFLLLEAINFICYFIKEKDVHVTYTKTFRVSFQIIYNEYKNFIKLNCIPIFRSNKTQQKMEWEHKWKRISKALFFLFFFSV